jgi:HTH domain
VARRTCECGGRVAPGEDCCPRCGWLDGWNKRERMIIDLLRTMPHATPYEIADEAGVCSRTVWRGIADLEKRGRVRRRVVDEGETFNPRCRCVVAGSEYTTVELVA